VLRAWVTVDVVQEPENGVRQSLDILGAVCVPTEGIRQPGSGGRGGIRW
jgi:hypothetical protein